MPRTKSNYSRHGLRTLRETQRVIVAAAYALTKLLGHPASSVEIRNWILEHQPDRNYRSLSVSMSRNLRRLVAFRWLSFHVNRAGQFGYAPPHWDEVASSKHRFQLVEDAYQHAEKLNQPTSHLPPRPTPGDLDGSKVRREWSPAHLNYFGPADDVESA